MRATAPALPVAGDGSDLVVAIPREILAEARKAFANEEQARNQFAGNKSARTASDLYKASLALSAAVDPILFADGLPD